MSNKPHSGAGVTITGGRGGYSTTTYTGITYTGPPEFDAENLGVQYKGSVLDYAGTLEQAADGTWTFDVTLTKKTTTLVKTSIPSWLRWGRTVTEDVENTEVIKMRVTGNHVWRYTSSGYRINCDMAEALQEIKNIIEHRIQRHGKVNKPGMGALVDLDEKL